MQSWSTSRAVAVSVLAAAAWACAPAAAPRTPEAKANVDALRHAVIPVPASIEVTPERRFAVVPTTVISFDPAIAGGKRLADELARLLTPALGAAPSVRPSGTSPGPGSIHFALRPEPSFGDEGYELTVGETGIALVAAGPAGLFYATQTLRQLLPWSIEYRAARPAAVTVPHARVVDAPRFAWRGAMLDVARHFFSVEDVERYIDFLALYKINRLHLHLSDDQGWRIDVKSWPNLTAHGGSTAVGGGAGGFYTQQQYSHLVRYAQDRFITIVPEIDMPGHTNAALASYPELNCDGKAPPLFTGIEVGFSTLCVDKDVTYRFITDVVREIGGLTPGEYFHVGGDEVQKLTPPQFIQFIERVQTIVEAQGKTMIGWGDVAPAKLSPQTIVQHWRPEAAHVEAAKGVKFILSPASKTYLDMKYDKSTVLGLSWAGEIELRTAYDWDPAETLPSRPADAILGVEAPLWTETVAAMSDLEFLAFPRLPALAEVAWSPAQARSWAGFERRVAAQAPRWTALGINFYRTPQVRW